MFIKNILKKYIFTFLERALLHNHGRWILNKTLGNQLYSNFHIRRTLSSQNRPYTEVGHLQITFPSRLSSQPVFVSGRFRSGSTLLWNIFRQIQTCTAYYEPLNERQWFDPDIRGDRLDSSHVNVNTDYWHEYEGLKDKLSPYYQEQWIHRDLYMDEESSDWYLQKYISKLIEHAKARPVLQFNRVDFRLPWLRRTFPNAKFVHIFRHPREQWLSTLMIQDENWPTFSNLYDFQRADKFYLRHWVEDLQFWFPFLRNWDLHPYCHFYFLWKLSYLFGVHYCDISIKFEELVTKPDHVLQEVFQTLDIDVQDFSLLHTVIQKPELNKWQHYATDEWFKAHEEYCEAELADFFA